ncbi:MAG: FAD-binding oxidoreductase [Deltaproteobacteria bacterium]|nr:FAD-binding oxidoreductase [Deltaproteobacteria bacterium]MBI4373286.1 FAD-binding oxidoreductase [Deltaproteobacteria bacterium]
MNFSIDDISLTVTCDTGCRLEELEEKLRLRGYTLGYEPFGSKKRTLCQILDQAPPNRCASRYGEIDDICMALLVESAGGPIQTKKVPRAATGPDLKKIFIGSKGRYGKLLEATFRICPLPERRRIIKIRLARRGQKETFWLKVLESGMRPAAIKEKGLLFLFDLRGSSAMVGAEERLLKKIQKTVGESHGS